jgi:outer membrane protein
LKQKQIALKREAKPGEKIHTTNKGCRMINIGTQIAATSKAKNKNINLVIKLALAALFATTLSSCVMLNPTDPYAGIQLPSHNRKKSSLQETNLPINGQISLADAIRISLSNNPGIAAARYSVDAAEAGRDMAFGAFLPNINLVSKYSHHLDGQRIGPPTYQGEPRYFSEDIFASDIVMTMPLFTGGRLISEFHAARLLQAASSHELKRNRQELVFNVSSVFYSILAQNHVIESLEFSQKTLNEHLKRITELISAKKAARVDQLRTEVRIADIGQRLVREQNVLAIQIHVLKNLMGIRQKISGPVTVSGKLEVREITVHDVEANLVTAFDQRGDYLAARAELEAQAKRVDSARAGHWPSMVLDGSYGEHWGGNASDDPSGSKSSEDRGHLGIGIVIPIFAGGRIQAKVRQERAKLASSLENLHNFELRIRLDVETAILNLSSSGERVKATKKSIEQAQESLRIERQKYDLAKGSITDVLDAQSALLNSQMNYYCALADYNTASAQYRLATGEQK